MLGCAFFFFQAEDGIQDYDVTGVQTCALPIFSINCFLIDATVASASIAIFSEAVLRLSLREAK